MLTIRKQFDHDVIWRKDELMNQWCALYSFHMIPFIGPSVDRSKPVKQTKATIRQRQMGASIHVFLP